jgi:hypothetical protein
VDSFRPSPRTASVASTSWLSGGVGRRDRRDFWSPSWLSGHSLGFGMPVAQASRQGARRVAPRSAAALVGAFARHPPRQVGPRAGSGGAPAVRTSSARIAGMRCGPSPQSVSPFSAATIRGGGTTIGKGVLPAAAWTSRAGSASRRSATTRCHYDRSPGPRCA